MKATTETQDFSHKVIYSSLKLHCRILVTRDGATANCCKPTTFYVLQGNWSSPMCLDCYNRHFSEEETN